MTRPSLAPRSVAHEHLNVYVRVRPHVQPAFVGSEVSTDVLKKSSLVVLDAHCVSFDPSPSSTTSTSNAMHGYKRCKDLVYVYDGVLDEHSTQEQVYKQTVHPLLEGILDGYNATVFAYGATGAGKTHTISGSELDPGVLPQTMQELFRRIRQLEENEPSCRVRVQVSYLEVYNETIRDLLADTSSSAITSTTAGLDLLEDGQQRVCVAGLSQHQPTTVQEVMDLLQQGNRNRTKSATKANQDSSRSHAVFQIHVEQERRLSEKGRDDFLTAATLTLCDLAGSERASVTENRGQQMREGASINRSLLALGNCIQALADNSKHVPFRDSKLTRLLKYSLGGNCRTIMIANVSPSMQHYDETHNTLKYAQRATTIRLRVEQNTLSLSDPSTVLIEELRAELAALRSKQFDAARIGPSPIALQTAIELLRPQLQELEHRLDYLADLEHAQEAMDLYQMTMDTSKAGADGPCKDILLKAHLSNTMESEQTALDDLQQRVRDAIEHVGEDETLKQMLLDVWWPHEWTRLEKRKMERKFNALSQSYRSVMHLLHVKDSLKEHESCLSEVQTVLYESASTLPVPPPVTVASPAVHEEKTLGEIESDGKEELPSLTDCTVLTTSVVKQEDLPAPPVIKRLSGRRRSSMLPVPSLHVHNECQEISVEIHNKAKPLRRRSSLLPMPIGMSRKNLLLSTTEEEPEEKDKDLSKEVKEDDNSKPFVGEGGKENQVAKQPGPSVKNNKVLKSESAKDEEDEQLVYDLNKVEAMLDALDQQLLKGEPQFQGKRSLDADADQEWKRIKVATPLKEEQQPQQRRASILFSPKVHCTPLSPAHTRAMARRHPVRSTTTGSRRKSRVPKN